MDAQELAEFNNARIEFEKTQKDRDYLEFYKKISRLDKISALEARIADATAKAEEALAGNIIARSNYRNGVDPTFALDDSFSSIQNLLAILKGGE